MTTAHEEDYRTFLNLSSFEEAQKEAELRNIEHVASQTGFTWIPVDFGPNVSPRFELIVMHKIGDPVSKSFNGDSYPEGEIVSISKSLKKITTSTGVSFYRRRLTGSWIADGTWYLTRGHVSEFNPSFLKGTT